MRRYVGDHTLYNSGNIMGQVALPFVLLVGGIIIQIVIAGSFISFFVNAASLGERLSVRALAAANTGVYDAIKRVAEDKEFAATNQEYSITVGSDSVTVSVSRTVDNTNNIYLYTVSSEATAQSRRRKIVAEFVVNQTTGAVALSSVSEQVLQ